MPTVAQLRGQLKARGLRTDGLKRELEARLAAAPPGAGRGTAIDDGGAIGAPGREGVEEDASDESEGEEEEQDQDSEQQGEGSDDGEELGAMPAPRTSSCIQRWCNRSKRCR